MYKRMLLTLLFSAWCAPALAQAVAPETDRVGVRVKTEMLSAESDGDIDRRTRGVVRLERESRGNYTVTFNRIVDRNRCHYIATIGNPGAGTADPGIIIVRPVNGQRRSLAVRIVDPNRQENEDNNFYLAVLCSQP